MDRLTVGVHTHWRDEFIQVALHYTYRSFCVNIFVRNSVDLCTLLFLVLVELLKLPYWSSYSKPRLWLHTVVSSKYFDLGISAVIGVNVITMAIEHYDMPKVISCFCKCNSRMLILMTRSLETFIKWMGVTEKAAKSCEIFVVREI